MKKTVTFAILAAFCLSAIAQTNKQEPPFSIKHNWGKIAGYSYQPGYPYGFSLSGGTLLSVGFADASTTYTINSNEQRTPTWSIRCGWLGYTFNKKTTGMGAITFRPMLVMGADFAKVSTLPSSGLITSDKKAYFTMAPTLVVNLYMVHFSVGYAFVPRFTQLNGINFGAGFSIPLPEASPSKATSHTKKKSTNSTKKKTVKR
jgi:hypothetical protein